MEAYFLTDIGQIRNNNEDAGGIFHNKDDQLLAIIADGMGGHKGGEVASGIAADIIQDQWENLDKIENPKMAEAWIQEAVNQANEAIYNKAKETVDLEGMGTTVVLAVCTEEYVTIGHVGDSRCYIYSDKELKQVTEDHSFVNELIRTGQISVNDAEVHPGKNVLSRVLGTDPSVTCETQTLEWEIGNKLLVCSDGLTNKVTNQELKDSLSKQENVKEISNMLVNLANDRGGEDNISMAIVHYNSTGMAGEET